MFKRHYISPGRRLYSPSSALMNKSDSLFHEMKKFQTGHDEAGNPRFAVPLSGDEDGMLGRECPAADCTPKYFKIGLDREERGEGSLSDAQITCPYCGSKHGFQNCHTQAQLEWVKSMMVRDVEQQIVRNLNDSFRSFNNTPNFLGIKMTARATLPPQVSKYVEEKLKRSITCNQCNERYAAYGLSYYCPFCACGTLTQHLEQNVQIIRVFAAEAQAIGEKHGQAAHYAMLGNAYGEVVSTFEGFLKQMYARGVRSKFPAADAERLVKQARTSFQRLGDAEVLCTRDLAIDLFHGVSSKDRERFALVFSKRHALTHNLGLVDEKYREKVRSWELPGQEVPISEKEAAWAADLAECILSNAARSMGF